MINETIISPAVAEDLVTVLPLFRSYQEHYRMLTNASEEQTRRFLHDLIARPESGFLLVAKIGSEVVGFAAAYLTVSGLIAQQLAHLGDLYVAPEHRKRGIGTELFEGVSSEARSRGVGFVRWLSLSSNTDVNTWYAKTVKPVGTFELYLRPTTYAAT